MQKNCSLCGTLQPADIKHFRWIKKGKGRWDSWCRTCYARRTREYNAKHPDERRSRDQAYYERTFETRKAYRSKYGKEYNERDAVKTWKRAHNVKLKREALEHYGGAFCHCCGEMEILMLCLDHIESNGAAHRKGLTGSTRRLPIQSYLWAKKNGWPPIFQVTCQNCNFARHWTPDKTCPHVLARQELTATAEVPSAVNHAA